MTDAIYLGDGAYATFNADGSVMLTANHHLAIEATDIVHLDSFGIIILINELQKRGGGDQHDR